MLNIGYRISIKGETNGERGVKRENFFSINFLS